MSAPVIPGFAFVEHLGSGGFADVFLYEQQWPRQRVAVKVVRPDVPLTDREKYLFTAEANSMARLADHPYIVSVITAGVTAEGGRPFLVMRYCPPPDNKRMGHEEYVAGIGSIPQAERKKIDLIEATTRMLAAKFPCPKPSKNAD